MSIKNCTLLFLIVCFLGASQVATAQTFFSETFDGEIPDSWTTVEVTGNMLGTSVWFHTTVGAAGPFAIGGLSSTTADNGFAIFDSDLDCDAVYPNPVPQDAWLISPEIDATDKERVWLIFETFYRSFNDRPTIRIGTDLENLVDWAAIEVFPGISGNDFGGILEGDEDLNPQLIELDLSEFAAGETFRFAFQYLSDETTANGGNLTGCGYAWMIDDIILTETDPRPAFDMRVNDFFAFAPNAITPVSQVEPFGFIADIANGGSSDQPSSTLNVQIQNSASETVYDESLVYGEIASDSTAENVFFPLEYAPPATPDSYTGAYILTGDDEDVDPENNIKTFDFIVSDSTFAKALTATTAVNPSSDPNYTYGCVYYVPNGTDVTNQYASSFSFGVSNPDELANRNISTFLWEWEGDTNEDINANPAEYNFAPVAFNAYTFKGDEEGLITLPVDIDGNLIELKSGFYYIMAIQYTTEDDQRMFTLSSEERDYLGTFFYSDSLDTKPIQYASAIDVGNTGDLDWRGFGFDIVPLITLNIAEDPTSAKELPILPDETVRIFPNPVKDDLTVDFYLKEQSEMVEMKLMDAAGKVILNYVYEDVTNERRQYNIRNLPSGNYWLRVITDDGLITKKVVVQK